MDSEKIAAKVATRKDLDFMGCTDCGNDCGPIMLLSSCHTEAQVIAEYKRGGVLVLLCGECKAEIVRMSVE